MWRIPTAAAGRTLLPHTTPTREPATDMPDLALASSMRRKPPPRRKRSAGGRSDEWTEVRGEKADAAAMAQHAASRKPGCPQRWDEASLYDFFASELADSPPTLLRVDGVHIRHHGVSKFACVFLDDEQRLQAAWLSGVTLLRVYPAAFRYYIKKYGEQIHKECLETAEGNAIASR